MQKPEVTNWRAWVRSLRVGEVKSAHLAKGQRVHSVRCAANVINMDNRVEEKDVFVHIAYYWKEHLIVAVGTTYSETLNYKTPNDWKKKIKISVT